MHLTDGCLVNISKATLHYSTEAPPPTSRKLAGSAPYSFIMSIVAIANPAPLTKHPMLPILECFKFNDK